MPSKTLHVLRVTVLKSKNEKFQNDAYSDTKLKFNTLGLKGQRGTDSLEDGFTCIYILIQRVSNTTDVLSSIQPGGQIQPIRL